MAPKKGQKKLPTNTGTNPYEGRKKKGGSPPPTRKPISYAMQKERAPIYKGPSKGGPRIRRRKPGTFALAEIRFYQKTLGDLIPVAPFRRLVREVLQNNQEGNGDPVSRFQSRALDALQAAAEAFLVDILQATNLGAIHGKRVTIQAKDVKHVISVGKILAPYSKILQDLPA
ncbi:histone-fold-containing protein [Byssothecium circinans]|uniref:Histone-fold-containing protein n=1 Tax=Byssothecium circinans TaxID=147558 RepID=A0A6A5T9S7_9PLEO|nr:histone-fold-containing protein [Byssothecium circinans]